MTGKEMYDRFCHELAAKNYSKKEFCQEIGISPGTLSNWGKRGTMPSAELLISMADFLGCSVDYLVGKSNIKNPDSKDAYDLSSEESKFIDMFRDANEEEKKFLAQCIALIEKNRLI